jgi:hypothetical protein
VQVTDPSYAERFLTVGGGAIPGAHSHNTFLPLSTLAYLRTGWQKVCDRYNTTAYVTQLRASAGLVCYTNRSDAEAARAIIKTLAPAGAPDA